MYSISDEQIDFIYDDIAKKGIDTEDVRDNILDHVCCIIEQEMKDDEDFHEFYRNTIARFYKSDLAEIEEETRQLITFKYYYAMKRTLKIVGIVSVVLIIAGSILKSQHLPGAGITMVSGFVFFSLLFIPLLIIMKFRDDKATKNRIVVTLGMILTLTGTLGLMMKFMHWPFANYLFFGSLALFGLVFIPIYFFVRYKDPELKFNTAINTVFMIAAAGMLFALTNLGYSKSYENNLKTAHKIQLDNIAQIEAANSDLISELSDQQANIELLTESSANLIQEIDGIRVNLIAHSENISESEAAKISILEIRHPDDFKVVEKHFEKANGNLSHQYLLDQIVAYNNTIQSIERNTILRKIDLDQTQLTKTSLSVLLNSLTTIKLQILSNENSYLCFQKGKLSNQ